MTVYYVSSKDFHQQVEAADPHEACVEAIRHAAQLASNPDEITLLLGREICVSCLGFDSSDAGEYDSKHVLTSVLLADED